MKNYLKIVLSGLIYSRECIYFQTYQLENRSGTGSLTFSAVLVGMFDSPLILSMLLIIEDVLFSEGSIRLMIPTSMTDLNAIIWAFLLGLLEVAYYRIGQRDIKIIDKFNAFDEVQLKKARIWAFWYAFIVLIGGIIILFAVIENTN